MDISKFNEKLNKIDGNTYVIEEVVTPVNGVYEAELAHDNISVTTLNVYTGSKLTGDKINTYTTATPSLAPWKTIIKIYSTITPIYITYETSGDTVEADDINNVQGAVVDTQNALNSEINRANNAEKVLTDNLNAEITRAKGSENTINSNLNAEITRAKGAENTITNTINSNKPNWDDKYTKNEIDNKFNVYTTNLDWKESVATFNDIATTYPSPQDGWTVNVKDTDITYRYGGTGWIPISANSIPLATKDVDGKMSKQDKIDHDDMVSKRHIHPNKGILDVITQALLDAWNAAYTHISDTVKHITSTERTLWNTVSNKLDANANAVSASKLVAARTIALTGFITGNGDFDGSGNLNIATLWNPTQLNSEDLNNITVYGQYYAPGNNSVNNKPSAADAFGLDVIKCASGWTLQILYASDNVMKIYYRYYNGVSWFNWYQFYDFNNKPSKSDVGLPNVDNTSDLSKPISTAVQNALNGKAPSGYGLGTGGLRLSTGTDLNTITNNGWYDVQAPVNAPYTTSSGWFNFLVICSQDNKYLTQLGFGMTVNVGTMYYRTCQGGTWGGWQTVSKNDHTHDDRYYTETEADNKFATKDMISNAGYGDMLRSVYDKDNDGIIDNADKLDGKHYSDITADINNAVNGIQIGGRNLMSNTNFYNGTNGWGLWNSATQVGIDSGRTANNKSLKILLANVDGSGCSTPYANCIGGHQYTISFWVKASTNCTITDLLKFLDSNGTETNPLGVTNLTLTANTWMYYSKTITIPTTAVKMRSTPRIVGANGTPYMWVAEYKLEDGNKATAWSPAPEDMVTKGMTWNDLEGV